MQIALKIAMVRNNVRQNRMVVDLGWDPAKLSRIVHEITPPTPRDRQAIADYLSLPESDLFSNQANTRGV